jgi:hypothetical protein
MKTNYISVKSRPGIHPCKPININESFMPGWTLLYFYLLNVRFFSTMGSSSLISFTG